MVANSLTHLPLRGGIHVSLYESGHACDCLDTESSRSDTVWPPRLHQQGTCRFCLILWTLNTLRPGMNSDHQGYTSKGHAGSVLFSEHSFSTPWDQVWSLTTWNHPSAEAICRYSSQQSSWVQPSNQGVRYARKPSWTLKVSHLGLSKSAILDSQS